MNKAICIKETGLDVGTFFGSKLGEICVYEKDEMGNYFISKIKNNSIVYNERRFREFFMTLQEFRNNKINEILNG